MALHIVQIHSRLEMVASRSEFAKEEQGCPQRAMSHQDWSRFGLARSARQQILREIASLLEFASYQLHANYRVYHGEAVGRFFETLA
jgi:hypothetical protein